MITLLVRKRTPGPDDAFGNTTWTWASQEWVARGIAPGSMEDQDRTTRDLSVVMWSVYADAGQDSAPDEDSQVQLPGDTNWYTVEGRPMDWTFGPPSIGPDPGPGKGPGVVVELRKADG